MHCRLLTAAIVLVLVSGCRALVNPSEPDQTVNYYGYHVSLKWLMAFKTVHCLEVNNPVNGELAEGTYCFDTQEEVFEAAGVPPPFRP